MKTLEDLHGEPVTRSLAEEPDDRAARAARHDGDRARGRRLVRPRSRTQRTRRLGAAAVRACCACRCCAPLRRASAERWRLRAVARHRARRRSRRASATCSRRPRLTCAHHARRRPRVERPQRRRSPSCTTPTSPIRRRTPRRSASLCAAARDAGHARPRSSAATTSTGWPSSTRCSSATRRDVNHYTYQFARRAAAEGLVVVDDPDSILKCTNKVYLNELLARHRVPVPKTLVVHRDNVDRDRADARLAVHPQAAGQRVLARRGEDRDAEAALREMLDDVLRRVGAGHRAGVAADGRSTGASACSTGRPLYVCKYFMAPGPLADRQARERAASSKGATVALSVGEAPRDRRAHRGARGQPDRRRPLRRRPQAGRRAVLRDRGQRQPQHRRRQRGRRAEGRALPRGDGRLPAPHRSEREAERHAD